MSTFLGIVMICLVPVLIGATETFDNIMKLFYERYREQWEQAGQPSGYRWQPKGIGAPPPNAFNMNHHICALVWLFSDPTWSQDDKEILKLLRRMRILVGTFNFGALILTLVSLHLR